MVEHLVCNQAVVGSNPVASTSTRARLELLSCEPVTHAEDEQPVERARRGSLKTKMDWEHKWLTPRAISY